MKGEGKVRTTELYYEQSSSRGVLMSLQSVRTSISPGSSPRPSQLIISASSSSQSLSSVMAPCNWLVFPSAQALSCTFSPHCPVGGLRSAPVSHLPPLTNPIGAGGKKSSTRGVSLSLEFDTSTFLTSSGYGGSSEIFLLLVLKLSMQVGEKVLSSQL